MQSKGHACGISSDVANRALLCLLLIVQGWQQDGELPLRGNRLPTALGMYGYIHVPAFQL